MSVSPPSLANVRALAERMGSHPADAVAHAARLQELVRALPPERADLISRVGFERASLWTLPASFPNLAIPAGQLIESEGPPQIIRCQHDVWIRGVVACAIPTIQSGEIEELIGILAILGTTSINYGSNWRWTFETNWRVDARQGFIGTGSGEILAPAALITGDGFYVAPVDWRLQKDQYIEVRVRPTTARVVPVDPDSQEDRPEPWIVVAFWAEEITQPSARYDHT